MTGTYQWDASYSGDTYNTSATENNAAAEQVAVNAARPTIATTPNMTSVTLGTSSVNLKDTAALSGGYHETGSITFTLYLGSTLLDTETVSVTGNGSYTTPTGYTLPTTGTVSGTYQWDATYNGDTNNNAVSENGATSEQVKVTSASPAITTTPSVTTVTLGTSSVTLNDTAALSGGYSPTGTISFTLYLGSTKVDTETATVNGNGSYTTPTGYTLPTASTVTGTYQWDASYSGDTNNNPVSDNNASNERVVVSPASPSITTTPGGSVTYGGIVKLTDTAVLSGGYNPGGTITFYLFAPGVTPNANDSNTVYSDQVTASGNGTYSTATGNNSGGYLPTATGTYEWVAGYGGNGNNNGVAGGYGSEPGDEVNSPNSVGSGEFATIGFWRNKNGQALILGGFQQRSQRHAARQLAGDHLPEPVRQFEPVHQQLSEPVSRHVAGRADQFTDRHDLLEPRHQRRGPEYLHPSVRLRPGHLRRHQLVRRERDGPGVRLQRHVGGRFGGDVQRR